MFLNKVTYNLSHKHIQVPVNLLLRSYLQKKLSATKITDQTKKKVHFDTRANTVTIETYYLSNIKELGG